MYVTTEYDGYDMVSDFNPCQKYENQVGPIPNSYLQGKNHFII